VAAAALGDQLALLGGQAADPELAISADEPL
jgi:hypothetical protein